MVLRVHFAAGLILFATALTASPVLAESVTVFSNFGPALAFQTGLTTGWTINGFFSPSIGQQAISQQFIPAESYAFEGARVALTLVSGPTAIDMFVQADTDGLPGEVRDVIHLRGFGNGPAVVSGTSTAQPLLLMNRPYWLTLVAAGPGVLAGWNWNSVSDFSDGTNFAGTQGGSANGPWSVGPGSIGHFRSAFEILGEPSPTETPEPNTLLLLTAGFFAPSLRRLRQPRAAGQRRRSASIGSTPSARRAGR